jgi:hypothetical protein
MPLTVAKLVAVAPGARVAEAPEVAALPLVAAEAAPEVVAGAAMAPEVVAAGPASVVVSGVADECALESCVLKLNRRSRAGHRSRGGR